MFSGRYGAGSTTPGTTLDDMHVSAIASQLRAEVKTVGTISEMLVALS
jgi:hypothetical protein